MIDLVTPAETLVLDPAVVFAYRRHTQSASAASLLTGRRLRDERRYYASPPRRWRPGWDRAARAARLRWTSRLARAEACCPPRSARATRAAVRAVVGHAFGRD